MITITNPELFEARRTEVKVQPVESSIQVEVIWDEDGEIWTYSVESELADLPLNHFADWGFEIVR